MSRIAYVLDRCVYNTPMCTDIVEYRYKGGYIRSVPVPISVVVNLLRV